MAFHHRKFLLHIPKLKELEEDKPKGNKPVSSLPPPSQVSKHGAFLLILIITVCFFGVVFLLLAYYVIRTYRSKGNTATNPATVENENLSAENEIDHGPAEEVDHHIWYIRTMGLPETAIDSIATFKYKRQRCCSKENNPVDCCVCLNEFQEDESLRLLPNCGHGFHVPCIDTWLRSHTNCPICRAPVVTTGGGGGGEVELVVAGSSGSGPTDEENRVDNGIGDFIESNDKIFTRNGTFRVSSDHFYRE